MASVSAAAAAAAAREEGSTATFPAAPLRPASKGLNVSGGGFGICACFSLAWTNVK